MRTIILWLLMAAFAAGAKAQNIQKVKAADVRMMMDTSTTPLIVNFWATWCAPCVEEIPWFDSILAEKKTNVKLLLVSLDFPESYPAKLTSFVTRKGYKGEVVYLDESNADYFCPVIEKQWDGAIPATLFINNKTNYKHFIGTQLSPGQITQEVAKLDVNDNDKTVITPATIVLIVVIIVALTAIIILMKKRKAKRP